MTETQPATVDPMAEVRKAIDDYRDALTCRPRVTRDIRAGHARMLLEAAIERAIRAAKLER